MMDIQIVDAETYTRHKTGPLFNWHLLSPPFSQLCLFFPQVVKLINHN